MNKRFVEIDHSGDVGIEARGADADALFANATRGLFALRHRGRVRAAMERKIRVEAGTVEDLLVDWLNEVIAVGSANGEFYADVVVHVGDGWAEGVLRGEAIDPARHEPRFDVKAATYHELDVASSAEGLRARVIFDL